MSHVVELLPFYVNGTLDAATSARVAAEVAECPQCAAELQATRAMSAAFAARSAAPLPASLATRVGAGISALEATPARPPAWRRFSVAAGWWGLLSLPAQFAVAAVLVVVAGAVGAGVLRHGTGAGSAIVRDGTGAGSGPPENVAYSVVSAPKANLARTGAVRTASQGPEPQAPSAPPVRKPQIARYGRAEVLVRDVPLAINQVRRIAAEGGGEITALSDTVPSDPTVRRAATVELTVEATRFDVAFDAVAALGAVRTRSVHAEDLSSQLVDESARLVSLEREEVDLRRIMDRGTRTSEILEAEARLSEVRQSIETLQAEIAQNRHRVATSSISVILQEDPPKAAPPVPSTTGIIQTMWRTAFEAAVGFGLGIIGTLLWCVAFAPYALGFGIAAYAGTRAVRAAYLRRIAGA